MLEEKVELKKPYHTKKIQTPVWELVLLALSKNAHSISSLIRIIKATEEVSMDIRYLTGYLDCMSELNLVRSVYVGTAKLHYLQPPDFLKYKKAISEKKEIFAKVRESKQTEEELTHTLQLLIHKGVEDNCPQCGGPMIHQEGIHKCLLCGECVEC